MLSLNVGLLAWGGYVHSPTLNEPGHLVAGVSYWQFGRFDIYFVNPPLVRAIAAAPVVLANPKTDWHRYRSAPGARAEFSLGEDFVAANGERSRWLFTVARWTCTPFSLLGAYLCYRWGTRLYSRMAGLLALTLWCFCPNLLAHGQFITPDVPATTLSLAACYSFWLWLKNATWTRGIVSGAILGIAELTKMTLVLLFPLWLLIWLSYRWQDRHTLWPVGWIRELGMLAAQMMIALYVINFGYGFEGSLSRLGDFKFVSASLGAKPGAEKAPDNGGNRFANTWLGQVPVPFPKYYLLGIDLQRRDFENYPHPSYLAGKFSKKGWWYYYLYALAIKLPLGTWLLLFLAATAGLWAWRPRVAKPNGDSPDDIRPERLSDQPSWRDEFVLLCPAVAILVFISSQTGFSEHMRYALPIFPFFFIWIGRIVPLLGRQRRALTWIALGAMLWSIGSSLAVYPHNLSYFNELVGGPMGGPSHLIQSNIDWGQDLYLLKEWINQHPDARPLRLAYFGYGDPKYIGIEYSAPDAPLAADESQSKKAIPPGWYAISINFIRGLSYFSYKGDGGKRFYAQDAFQPFQKMKPTTTVGYSIYIYHVTPDEQKLKHK